MHWTIATRETLIARAAPAGRALLLEGSWTAGNAATQGALDDAVDGRYDFIDQQAAAWADELSAGDDLSPWALNALELRYYLVKLLRVVVYLTEIQPLRCGDRVELYAQRGRDADYAQVLQALCRAAGAALQVAWCDGPIAHQPVARNGLLRRAAGWLTRPLDNVPRDAEARPRIVFCGNPRRLWPVCDELLARGVSAWWLYDRFAFRAWWHDRPRGVRHLLCNSQRGVTSQATAVLPQRMAFRGVDLSEPLAAWLLERMATRGPAQAQIVRQLTRHFARVRPAALILEEDATPLARAAVAVGRRYGAASMVVQHGAPCCRFGFAPLAADRIFAWGDAAQRQFRRWGIPAERIVVTGAPQVAGTLRVPSASLCGAKVAVLSGRHTECACYLSCHVLLLATVPPRDARPDAVAMHLTRKTYAQMLHAVCAVLDRRPGVRLSIKLHPRCGNDPLLRAVLGEFPGLTPRIITGTALEACLDDVDCVISCGSTAGIEAAWAGLPVVHLVPAGDSSFLSEESWGMAGIARNEQELETLVAAILSKESPWAEVPGSASAVFAATGHAAAQRIAQGVLALVADRPQTLPLPTAGLVIQGRNAA